MVGFVFPASSAANGMWHIGTERNPAHAVATDRLLLCIDRFAVGVVAGYMDGATAACRTDSVASDVSITSEHEYIIPQRLEVVAGSISSDVTAVVKLR